MGLPVAVFGASGYGGGELVRLLDGHHGFDLVYLGAHSRAGGVLGDVHPQLEGGDRRLGPNDPDAPGPLQLAFLALPHGASAPLGRELAHRGVKVVDLGSDFRLDNDDRYQEAYRTPHPFPGELSSWIYGLPELVDLTQAAKVASPGCYPTATILAIAPLLAAGVIEPTGIVADCLSGVSGAGRALKDEFLFGEVAEGVRAYSVTTHRHRPEIEMALDQLTGLQTRVTFTPHLVPMQRGLLATVTSRLTGSLARDEVITILTDFYQGRPFVEVIDRPPQTRWTVSSNRALVTAFIDDRQGVVVSQCALDNLVKGAAGQAIQAANLMSGLDETLGLPLAGWMP
ncbi:MAG TPA: N-acetyl-gamma-glutamyl-phosphate reductase [Acidimicrobiia bacterium]|nr:N-acetyl-gamma-glutamyl-phosphate reductase [Acidimicrobiia bacterium]